MGVEVPFPFRIYMFTACLTPPVHTCLATVLVFVSRRPVRDTPVLLGNTQSRELRQNELKWVGSNLPYVGMCPLHLSNEGSTILMLSSVILKGYELLAYTTTGALGTGFRYS